MKHIFKIFYLLLSVFPLFFQGNDVWSATCSSQKCHPGIGQQQTVHGPVAEGECSVCHESTNPAHPSGVAPDFTPAATGSALCFGCHDQKDFVHRNEHGPVASGGCTYCHDPHNSKNSGLLRKPLREMCFHCHTDFAENLGSATHVHSAISELDCGACHLPHGSDSSYLLKGDPTTLCFECHNEIGRKYKSSLNKHKALYIRDKCGNCHSAHYSENRSLLLKNNLDLCLDCHGRDDNSRSDSLRNIRKEIEGKEFVHGPVAEGQCVECHDPHGSSYSLILKGPYPETFYAPFKAELYDLCFECHDKELLAARITEGQTGFRNGTENLHHLHVAIKGKGRTCRACHSVHASDGAKLINPDGIPFGDWKVPIRYTATETGGSCAPGCHRPMDYDREQPVDNIEQEEPAETRE